MKRVYKDFSNKFVLAKEDDHWVIKFYIINPWHGDRLIEVHRRNVFRKKMKSHKEALRQLKIIIFYADLKWKDFK